MEFEHQRASFFDQSIKRQVGDMVLVIADRESIITAQQKKIEELEKELDELRKQQIEEMDNA